MEIVQLEEVNGVWSTEGPKRWESYYYVYEVSVYHPSTLQVEKCHANDPYARGYTGCLIYPTITKIANVLSTFSSSSGLPYLLK